MDRHQNTLQEYLPLLHAIPYSREFFITGSVARGEEKKESDIDLIVVAKQNRVWLNRMLMTLIMAILGVRRTKSKRRARFCLNATVGDKNSLSILSKIHGQVKPLTVKNGRVRVFKSALETAMDFTLVGAVLDTIGRKIISLYVRQAFKKFQNDKDAVCILEKNQVVYHPPRLQKATKV